MYYFFVVVIFCGALLKFTNPQQEGQGSHLQTPNPSPQQITTVLLRIIHMLRKGELIKNILGKSTEA